MGRTILVAAVLLLLPLVATAGEPDGSKRLKKADKKLQSQINLAIRKGRYWLLSQQQNDGSFPHPYGEHLAAGGTALSILTMLHCGVKPEDRHVRKGFEFLRKQYARDKAEPLSRTSGLQVYETAVTIMALAQLGTEKVSPRKRRGRPRVYAA